MKWLMWCQWLLYAISHAEEASMCWEWYKTESGKVSDQFRGGNDTTCKLVCILVVWQFALWYQRCSRGPIVKIICHTKCVLARLRIISNVYDDLCKKVFNDSIWSIVRSIMLSPALLSYRHRVHWPNTNERSRDSKLDIVYYCDTYTLYNLDNLLRMSCWDLSRYIYSSCSTRCQNKSSESATYTRLSWLSSLKLCLR